MKYEIIGGSFPVVECTLKSGEAMITQSGSMAYMDPTITMETSTNGGLKKVVGRLFSNEHLFQNIYTSTKDGSKIAFGTCVPGSIMAIEVKTGKPLICQKRTLILFFLQDYLIIQIDHSEEVLQKIQESCLIYLYSLVS